MPTTPLKKLNDIITTLIKGQNFTATLGAISDDTLWASTFGDLKNGNTLLTLPGPLSNEITVKASSMLLTPPMYGLTRLRVITDQVVMCSPTIPFGARTDGTNYYFSEHDPWNETVVLLGGYYNHLYVTHDPLKPSVTALGVIATPTASEPSSSLVQTFISNSYAAGPRQAFCQGDVNGRVLFLQTFPQMVNPGAAVVQDAPAVQITWAKTSTSQVTNAIQLRFSFPAGIGTGSVGEIAIKMGTDFVGYIPVSPQLEKDSDIPLTVIWNLMVGEPGTF